MVTLTHRELNNVGMQAMTMAFRAKDSALFNSVKEDDNFRRRVENVDATLVVAKIAV